MLASSIFIHISNKLVIGFFVCLECSNLSNWFRTNLAFVVLGIDGRGDMKLIYGIIAAEKKVKPGKEDKVFNILILILLNKKSMISYLGSLCFSASPVSSEFLGLLRLF